MQFCIVLSVFLYLLLVYEIYRPTFTSSGLCFSSVVSGSPHGNLRVVHEEISLQGSGSTVLKKLSTPEPQLLPVLDAAVLSTCNEGEGSGSFCDGILITLRRFASSVVLRSYMKKWKRPVRIAPTTLIGMHK